MSAKESPHGRELAGTGAAGTPADCSWRLEATLSRIATIGSPESAIFTETFVESARASARDADRRLRTDRPIGPLDGVLVSVKGSLDVEGSVTTAGSPLLARREPAARDAEVVERLRTAGAIIVGKTQMSELAFSAVGLNPHAPLLMNPRDTSRVTGGSSAGAAASIAAGLVDLAIGGDTGGSVRLPAALCGVTGFKPGFDRISARGAFPLSTTLDCVGLLAGSVRACADAYTALCRSDLPAPSAEQGEIRLIRAGSRFESGLDPFVGQAYETALHLLSTFDIRPPEPLVTAVLDALDDMDRIGVFTVPELLATLHEAGVQNLDDVDPMIRRRIDAHAKMTAIDYVRLLRRRDALKAAMHAHLRAGDILVTPTVPSVAPRICDLRSLEDQSRVNAALVRNTRAANLLDLPAISLPLRDIDLPVGLMLMARTGDDELLLAAAESVEARLAAAPVR